MYTYYELIYYRKTTEFNGLVIPFITICWDLVWVYSVIIASYKCPTMFGHVLTSVTPCLTHLADPALSISHVLN